MDFFSNDLWGERAQKAEPALSAPQWVPCGLGWRQGGSFATEPSARGGFRPWRDPQGLSSARGPRRAGGSPLPAVFATRCHLKPSILSIGAPCPLTSTRARRFWAIGLFLFWRPCATAPPRRVSFFGVPVAVIKRDGVFDFGVDIIGKGSGL